MQSKHILVVLITSQFKKPDNAYSKQNTYLQRHAGALRFSFPINPPQLVCVYISSGRWLGTPVVVVVVVYTPNAAIIYSIILPSTKTVSQNEYRKELREKS